jgi:GTP-binding protein YchF
MKIGIIGPPQSGKTTVFSSLTGLAADGYGGKDSNVGVVKVPEPRLDVLTGMYKPKKTVPAEITFVDLASLGTNDKLTAMTAQLADAEALAIVIGAYDGADPCVALDSFLLELVLADLSIIESRLERLDKELARGRKEAAAEKPLIVRCQEHLARGKRLGLADFQPEELKLLRGYQLATLKPGMVLVNVGEKDLESGVLAKLNPMAEAAGLDAIELCAPIEAEIAQLPPEDRAEFLADYGLAASARDRFIRAAYGMLDLLSFFTVGPDEVRAWTISRGTKAPQAAGKIHSDIERGFIRAEVVAYDDLIAAGSHAACRPLGQVRLEGKEYEVKDGDVIEFRFSV